MALLSLPFYFLILMVLNVTKLNNRHTDLTSTIPETTLATYSETNCEDSVHKYCQNRRIKYIQVYHISKAGGTTLRRALQKVLNLSLPDTKSSHPWAEAWSRLDFDVWRSEKENQCDVRYNRDPNSELKQEVFILGLVRNPFSYYRSYHIMVTSDKFNEPCKMYLRTNGQKGDYSKCFCEMKVAYDTDRSYLYLNQTSIQNNRSSFDEFVRFLMLPETKHCSVDMQDRHDNTMNMKDGSYAYDYAIKQEYFWNDVTKALKIFDCCLYPKPIVQWDVFYNYSSSSNAHQVRSQFLKIDDKTTTKIYPDFCYYDIELRKIVEDHDGKMMRLHGYNWENFVGDGRQGDCLGL